MSKNNNNSANDLVQFLVGLAMFVAGGFLFLNNVTVTSYGYFNYGFFGFGGRFAGGLMFVPLIASIIFLFYKYGIASKICVGLSITLIIANVIASLNVHWNPLSLFGTIVIFVLLFGGIGLLLKVLLANPNGKHGKNYDAPTTEETPVTKVNSVNDEIEKMKSEMKKDEK